HRPRRAGALVVLSYRLDSGREDGAGDPHPLFNSPRRSRRTETPRVELGFEGMSIRDWLHAWSASPRGDTETVQRIVRELGRIDPQRARHIAAFAYLLSRAAAADRHVTAAKT